MHTKKHKSLTEALTVAHVNSTGTQALWSLPAVTVPPTAQGHKAEGTCASK